ncbi:hypothetical protein PROVRUST_06002 [Providencia rustigianii DSM 4541]|uniref:Uncharacterized protein n=1 Tax=Providencia rustigianii DSM 4541 TaxID=500637 RepID=D1P1D5_9GAMM|nr:hypothetical protein PROVRUST_06002 [Providencia rustigianii DSM 4541]
MGLTIIKNNIPDKDGYFYTLYSLLLKQFIFVYLSLYIQHLLSNVFLNDWIFSFLT